MLVWPRLPGLYGMPRSLAAVDPHLPAVVSQDPTHPRILHPRMYFLEVLHPRMTSLSVSSATHSAFVSVSSLPLSVPEGQAGPHQTPYEVSCPVPS